MDSFLRASDRCGSGERDHAPGPCRPDGKRCQPGIVKRWVNRRDALPEGHRPASIDPPSSPSAATIGIANSAWIGGDCRHGTTGTLAA